VTQSEPGSAAPGSAAPTPAVSPPPGLQPAGANGQSESDVTNPELERLSRENANWRAQLRAKELELEKLKAAGLTDAEKAIAEAKKAGASEYEQKWRKVLLDNAALTVLADKRVMATELALRGLDLSDIDVDTTTGNIDRRALETKIDELIQRYPMLAPDGPLPGIGSTSGAQQHQVQRNQLARPGESEQDALNRLARYALGND
jgi:hypothetical protein